MKKYDWKSALYYDDLAIIRLNNKEGFINKKGEVICEIKYDEVYDFETGFAVVVLNNKYGYINQDGEEICEIKYDFVFEFNNGLSKVKRNGKYGYMNEVGVEIIPCKYNYYEIILQFEKYNQNRLRKTKLEKIL